MSKAETRPIEAAIKKLEKKNPPETGGEWLELMAVEVAPHIKEWDIKEAHRWTDWEERREHFPQTTKVDVGIDVVAVRNDGEHIAIQCKSRQLDENQTGEPLTSEEIAKFVSASRGNFWRERWIVTNGINPLASGAMQADSMSEHRIKSLSITAALYKQQQAAAQQEQTKAGMQKEAVAKSVAALQKNKETDSDGIPKGQARGKIILPCGTGKTRISLKIIEQLTAPGELSIVLCPSIALVAQIRQEYLQHTALPPLDILAVCSDVTAGYDATKEGKRNTATDPTIDNSNVSADEVKGEVTTDAKIIAKWMKKKTKGIKVLIGTYQSSIKVSEALLAAKMTAQVLVADEAHRTAGLKRKKTSAPENEAEKRLRDFAVCHNNALFPAVYRIYQTATPRIYDNKKRADNNPRWLVRSMDDIATFGVELYRKSYLEAVKNKWLSDYRIIAVGVNDAEAYEKANRLARETQSAGNRKLTTADYLRGLPFALAMGGAIAQKDVDIRSCIAFMNTVDKSKNMANDLQSAAVKEYVEKWVKEHKPGRKAANYKLEHLDASNNILQREGAKEKLSKATKNNRHAIINVGIFGEGTDSPSLSAVAFLEPRKSPIDVVQAVGRAMRTAPGKTMGYIICPIVFPQTADPETWLSNSGPEDGWQELGEILKALRAHDNRIEDNLSDLMKLYIPQPPAVEHTFIAIAKNDSREIEFGMVKGKPGEAEKTAREIAADKEGAQSKLIDFSETSADDGKREDMHEIITVKQNSDGKFELRRDAVVCDKPKSGEMRGKVNVEKTKKRARRMINKGEGAPILAKRAASRKSREEVIKERMGRLFDLGGLREYGDAIRVNLLNKSGLTTDRVMRDLNILKDGVSEAARHLRDDDLLSALNEHFVLDEIENQNGQADGCTIAALLMMNAAMLHQRIAVGEWLDPARDMAQLKNDPEVISRITHEWERIMRHDFRPVLEPALETIFAIEKTGKRAGLERALHHLAAEAERIAETYADMGADHAGPLFNKVMGNQASDGAFFTRPPAASLAARLTLDACGKQNWREEEVWLQHKILDLACGSGALLAAMLADMKRRAKEDGATKEELTELQILAVENVINGLDINPVSLQLAASQLTAGNQCASYSKMGLHQMPYGPSRHGVLAGSLELLGQQKIVRLPLELGDERLRSRAVLPSIRSSGLKDGVEAARNARIVIMNPPFTNRSKMGEKYSAEIKGNLRRRVDGLAHRLTQSDKELAEMANENSIEPLFATLADCCIPKDKGILTMINPTIALTAPSSQQKRLILARRFHVHTILTSHQPDNINLSQHTAINESIIVLCRRKGKKPATRFVNLDKLPADDKEVAEFFNCLRACEKKGKQQEADIANGWGVVSRWPEERIAKGDWTPAIWRSPKLAQAAVDFAAHPKLQSLQQQNLEPQETGRVLRGHFEKVEKSAAGGIPILKSRGAEAQTTICSTPDEYWATKKPDKQMRQQVLEKAGFLLITNGQDNSSARLTATAADKAYVGNGWMPILGLLPQQAKAAAVFINSTAGRLQLMRHPGKKLAFPSYSITEAANLKIPSLKDKAIVGTLSKCWETTRNMPVPQFRDGECEVRRLWDEAVEKAMGWKKGHLRPLRELLHKEPHVRGLGYNEYK